MRDICLIAFAVVLWGAIGNSCAAEMAAPSDGDGEPPKVVREVR